MTEQNDFAAGLKELEEITEWFESENVELDQGLKKFERGVELVAQLRQQLQVAENRVKEIKQKFEAQAVPAEPLQSEDQ